jgi:hypothetical protein
MPVYPDISDILARKAKGRRELAARSFGEKLEILEAMRARVEPIRRARAARVSSSEALVAQNRDDLRRLFQVLGVQVGPRHGPNRRTNEQKEWYCLRRYLLALAANGLLHYPVKIYKSESPDFVVCDSVRGIFGVEVTTATEQDWERELSRSDAAMEAMPLHLLPSTRMALSAMTQREIGLLRSSMPSKGSYRSSQTAGSRSGFAICSYI